MTDKVKRKLKKESRILFKTPQAEMEFADLCTTQYMRINELMNMIEREFETSMHEHYDIRNRILDTSNFVRRLPDMISEVIEIEVAEYED